MTVASPVLAVRPATFRDLEAVAGLLRRVFGVDRSADALAWKFSGCVGRLTGSMVLTSDRDIVGFLGQVPTRIRVMGREILAAQGADVSILETHRRLDSFMSLVTLSVRELRSAGVALSYGIANADATTVSLELFGRKRLSTVPLLVRPLRAAGAPLLGRGAGLITRALAACADRGRFAVPGDFRLSPVGRFDDRFDLFWRRVRDDYPVMLVRDAAYLNWRYVDTIGGGPYESIVLRHAESGGVEGYAVLGLTRRGGRVRGRLCELVTPRHDAARATQALIGACVKRLHSQGADTAEVWALPHTHLRIALMRRGFIPRRTGGGGFQVSALAADVDPDLVRAEDARQWFLSMGDSDTV